MGRLGSFVAFALLIGGFAQAHEKEIDLGHLVSLAMERNPRLVALRFVSEAETFRARAQGVLPDPVIQFGLKNIGWDHLSVGEEMMSGYGVSISQAIPFPGKLALRSSMANTKAAQYAQSLAAAQLALVRQVKELYAGWFSASRALALLNRKASTLQDARRYAEARYVVGQSPQEHLLKAELEIYHNQEMILLLEEKVRSTRIQLGSLLDVPEDSLVGAPREIPFTSFPYELGELQAWALRNPALVQARLMAREESLAVRLAKRDLMPNLMIQAGKEFKGPFKDMYEVMLGLEIPLYFSKKQMPLVQAAQLQLESSRHNLRDMEIEIETELHNNYVMAKYGEKRIALYRERILPQAELSLRASISAYQANETDFLALLTDINDLFSHQIEYARTLAALWAAAARLEELTGKELLGANEGK